MAEKLLLTSFQTWLPHQTSNSSDDLLAMVTSHYLDLDYLYLQRKLPVDTQLATEVVIQAINIIQPKAAICCGMAAKRKMLTIESQAIYQDRCLTTTVDLELLLGELHHTQISHDAGKFVCEGLYYQVLNYIQTRNLAIPCIFVHVPLLDRGNLTPIMRDFIRVIKYFQSLDFSHYH